MAMGRKARQRRQEAIWIAQTDLPRTVAHPFYEQLNRLLEERSFDEWVEQQCTRFYAERMGRPSLAPGRYFRLLLIGYFEGIDSERGIAGRAADSLALRSFLGAGLNEMPPDVSAHYTHNQITGCDLMIKRGSSCQITNDPACPKIWQHS